MFIFQCIFLLHVLVLVEYTTIQHILYNPDGNKQCTQEIIIFWIFSIFHNFELLTAHAPGFSEITMVWNPHICHRIQNIILYSQLYLCHILCTVTCDCENVEVPGRVNHLQTMGRTISNDLEHLIVLNYKRYCHKNRAAHCIYIWAFSGTHACHFQISTNIKPNWGLIGPRNTPQESTGARLNWVHNGWIWFCVWLPIMVGSISVKTALLLLNQDRLDSKSIFTLKLSLNGGIGPKVSQIRLLLTLHYTNHSFCMGVIYGTVWQTALHKTASLDWSCLKGHTPSLTL